ncbi:MAG: hypothetical protein SAK29_23195 [Scytonema sp. PMC 1069.18]|nr:hypothetical protein [Scytonema sp. PMC 1069.18]MEC4887780.1 hypothetical protein [Scytonema sp. PMC 1070.18]
MIKLKVTRKQFNLANPDGFVDGKIPGKNIYAYVVLGFEKEYIPNPKDDPKTDYRIFFGCSVYYASSEQDLKDENFKLEEHNLTVIIYC